MGTDKAHDMRGRERGFSVDRDAFQMIGIDTPVAAFADPEEIRKTYYPVVAELVKAAVGAARVHVFDHNSVAAASPTRTCPRQCR